MKIVFITGKLAERALRETLGAMEAEFDYEVFVQVQCLQSTDHKEGVAAFLGRRPPRFAGAPQ